MSDDEFFDEFYAKLNDIINSAYNLGEIYDQPKIVRKILRSLTKDFKPKVAAITESKDVDSIHVDELVGPFLSYELDLPKTSKSKSMALKSIDDVDVGGFDDELFDDVVSLRFFSVFILPRTSGSFLETTIEGQEIRTLLNLEILGRMIPLRLTTLKNLEKK